MGISFGGIMKDLGINLPKIDLGSIGKTVLDEGKKLLGEVVKDSFTLSSKPGETFADQMNLNVLGDNVRLPNPIGALANKLLGGVDNKLNQYGVNVDFKTILGKFFHLPTEQGDVTVPPLKQRMATQNAGAVATGGGAVTASDATAGSGAAAVGGGSATTAGAPTVSGGYTATGGSNPDNGIVSALGSEDTNLNSLISSLHSGMDPADLAKVQAQIQEAQEMISTLSNILKEEHDMRMSIVNNVRA